MAVGELFFSFVKAVIVNDNSGTIFLLSVVIEKIGTHYIKQY